MTAAELTLRPLQEATLEKVRDAWRTGAKNVLVQAPCGFGKTEIATAMLIAARDKGSRGAFVCDRLSLIDQTGERFDRYGLDHGVIQSDHWRWRPWQKIQLCSIQTLQRRSWPDTDLLLIDEAHILPRAIKERLSARDTRAVGLTATPFTKGLGRYFDVLVNAATTNQLIREGWLTPFRIFSASTPNMEGVAINNKGEYEEKEAEQRVLPVVGDCVAEYVRLGEDRKFVAFAVSVAHAEELQRQFMAAGVVANLYTYRQSDEERQATVAEFRKPDSYIRGLISIESLTRGFDVPDVGVLILARPLRKSLATHIQMLGRVLRTAEGKTDAIVLDHAGNCVRFWDDMMEFLENGWPALDDGKTREQKAKANKERQPVTCSRCHHVHAPLPMCPSCGFEYPRKNAIHHAPGELSELGEGGVSNAEKRTVYAQLLWIARDRGYSSGWAAHKFKERFGTWPNFLQPEPETPTMALQRWVRSRMIAWAKARKSA